MLELELRIGLIGSIECDEISGLHQSKRLYEFIPSHIHLLVTAVLVEILHKLIQETTLLVFGLIGQKHQFGKFCYFVDTMLDGRRTTCRDYVQVDYACIRISG